MEIKIKRDIPPIVDMSLKKKKIREGILTVWLIQFTWESVDHLAWQTMFFVDKKDYEN